MTTLLKPRTVSRSDVRPRRHIIRMTNSFNAHTNALGRNQGGSGSSDTGEPNRSTKVYAALGDSMSIDLYPNRDLGIDYPQSLPIGAASLLFRNDDELWPEFAGVDLRRNDLADGRDVPAADGAMLRGDLESQLAVLSADTRIVTLTIGGNDLFFSYSQGVRGHALMQLVETLQRSFVSMVELIHRRAPEATVVFTTVYDPSDGTGSMMGMSNMPLEHLQSFNDTVRETAARNAFAQLADVHQHFLGHGLTADQDNRWYWPQSIIEPSARGASEIRRCWASALGLNALATLSEPTQERGR